MASAIIIGGGISGLAAAYYLQAHSVHTTLIEAEDRAGGLIRTDRIEGCDLEAGPDSYLAAKQEVTELARELPALNGKLIGTNDRHRRIFIVRNGRLEPLPSGMVMMVPSDLRAALSSNLFPPATRKRILQERFFRPLDRGGDFSVAELVLDHFDQTVLDTVAEPLLTGVYGGDAARLSAPSVLARFAGYEKQRGSLIRAVRAEKRSQAASSSGTSLFQSFEGGMQTLTNALRDACASSTQWITGAATEAIHTNGEWCVTVGGRALRAGSLVVALPAHRAAALFPRSSPPLAAALNHIPYSSAITVVLVYLQRELSRLFAGFGYLVPRSERGSVAAVTLINTKFPDRVAPGLVAMRAFLVGDAADRLMAAPGEEIVSIAHGELSTVVGLPPRPAFHTLHRWPRSMPQYTVGHAERIRHIQNLAANLPHLHLAGNYFDGVGIPDCVRWAKTAAQRIASGNNTQ